MTNNKVRDTARLHPSTVTNYRDHTPRKVRTMTRTATRPKTLRVHPTVWAMALTAAGGDRSRIIVLSETAVRVINQSQRKAGQ